MRVSNLHHETLPYQGTEEKSALKIRFVVKLVRRRRGKSEECDPRVSRNADGRVVGDGCWDQAHEGRSGSDLAGLV